MTEAKADDSKWLAARALGEVDAASDPIKDAQRELEQAEAAHETAKRTQAGLEAEARTAENELAFAIAFEQRRA